MSHAEIMFCDPFVKDLESLQEQEAETVLAEVVALCRRSVETSSLDPATGARLAGWNTLYVLGGRHRVVFAYRVVDDVGVIDVLCSGSRNGDALYDMAADLTGSGKLTEDEVSEIWVALALLEIVVGRVGEDAWDDTPKSAPVGMQRAAVSAGLLELNVATVLTLLEMEAAMTSGWGADGKPDKLAALTAALQEARLGFNPGDVTRILQSRLVERCGALLPVKQRFCTRRTGHTGGHRSTN